MEKGQEIFQEWYNLAGNQKKPRHILNIDKFCLFIQVGDWEKQRPWQFMTYPKVK